MLSRNLTPFAAMGFSQLHRDGPMMACIAVRGSFDILASGKLSLSNHQELMFADHYNGDPHHGCMLRPTDLVPFKPATDVTLTGNAYPPDGRPSSDWTVAISVASHRMQLRVHGPRQWLPGLKHFKPSWKLGPSETVENVQLDYRMASGGRYIGDPEGDADRRNPIGPGLLHGDYTRFAQPFTAPQIESVDVPIQDPYDAPEPQGFGPIPPWWIQRQGYAGTYDDDWKQNRHPRLPADFDYRFYQSAHPGLIMSGFLNGNESVTVEGCRPRGETVVFQVPGMAIVADHTWDDGRQARTRLNLDGLHMDFRGETPRVDVTWRGWITRCPAYLSADIDAIALADAMAYPASDEQGLAETANVREDATS
ncbi:DUF2169 family type VI secretion system accessory protein [Agrobacterium vitis]|uniref:DUF2169 family type VI secretion system accessory protein n=1 Tax=Agrobacterium vitis TaxID=373 RepID=UPI0012E856FB|nr:DUF2169 domain-containing protein [Agrobacterium vitis]MUZ66388.1 DUF2169 domain-containing protein [Agrobacterium vitis]